MNVTVTSNTDSAYTLKVCYKNVDWFYPVPEQDMTGFFDTEVAASYSTRADVEVDLYNNVPYDFTIHVTWGPLTVDGEASTWSGVQALFR
jgi:hypothetical protein